MRATSHIVSIYICIFPPPLPNRAEIIGSERLSKPIVIPSILPDHIHPITSIPSHHITSHHHPEYEAGVSSSLREVHRDSRFPDDSAVGVL